MYTIHVSIIEIRDEWFLSWTIRAILMLILIHRLRTLFDSHVTNK